MVDEERRQNMLLAEKCSEYADQITELEEALKDANDALRSAHEVCKREGKDTRWPELTARIKRSLESQHKLIYGKAPGLNE